jgi:hypothetical protein
MTALSDVYGDLLIVRPPVPATVNKAGANYKSEVAHLEYSPRRAYDEWLSILDAIAACGGDAIYQFEAADEPFLDRGPLEVTGDGAIRPRGSRETLGRLDDVMTGRCGRSCRTCSSIAAPRRPTIATCSASSRRRRGSRSRSARIPIAGRAWPTSPRSATR